jgi:hypothetical protein
VARIDPAMSAWTKAQVQYLQPSPGISTYAYTFAVPSGTAVGDRFWDGRQIVQVVAIGSSYDGPIRMLTEPLERR